MPCDAVAEFVRESPYHTPTAISFLIVLRRSGVFSNATSGSRHCPIPRRLAQYWDEDIPADVEKMCAGWRQKHSEFTYSRFSKTAARRYIAESGITGALTAFDRAIEPAMKADLFRLAYLYREGGWYVDADDRCMGSISDFRNASQSLLVYQEDFGTIGNNFIGVAPAHPVLGYALAEAVKAVNRGDHDVVWLSTGPGLLTRSLARYFAENLRGTVDVVAGAGPPQLTDIVAMHCVASYKHTTKHWSRTAFRSGRISLQPRADLAKIRRIANSIVQNNSDCELVFRS